MDPTPRFSCKESLSPISLLPVFFLENVTLDNSGKSNFSQFCSPFANFMLLRNEDPQILRLWNDDRFGRVFLLFLVKKGTDSFRPDLFKPLPSFWKAKESFFILRCTYSCWLVLFRYILRSHLLARKSGISILKSVCVGLFMVIIPFRVILPVHTQSSQT